MRTSTSLAAFALFASSLLGALPSVDALAQGDGTRGGADVAICHGYRNNVMLADILDATYFGNDVPSDLFDFAPTDDIFRAVLAYLTKSDAALASELTAAFSELAPSWGKFGKVDTGMKIPVFDKIFGLCRRRTIAWQYFAKGDLVLDQKEFAKLTHLHQALLQLHEAFMRVKWKRDTLAGSTAIDVKALETYARAQVSGVFNRTGFNHEILSTLLASRENPAAELQKTLKPWLSYLLSPDDLTSQYALRDFQQLLEAGLDPNIEVGCGMPVLMYLMSHISGATFSDLGATVNLSGFAAAALFIKNGAKVNVRDRADRTPLEFATNRIFFTAAVSGQPDTAFAGFDTLLAQPGADINAVSCVRDSRMDIPAGDTGETAMDWALSTKKKYVIQLLRSYGAKTARELGATCPARKRLEKCGIDLPYPEFGY